jgi:hypothetical protein
VDFAVYTEERETETKLECKTIRFEALTATEFNEVFLGIQPC